MPIVSSLQQTRPNIEAISLNMLSTCMSTYVPHLSHIMSGSCPQTSPPHALDRLHDPIRINISMRVPTTISIMVNFATIRAPPYFNPLPLRFNPSNTRYALWTWVNGRQNASSVASIQAPHPLHPSSSSPTNPLQRPHVWNHGSSLRGRN